MTHDERCFEEWSVAYELPTPECRDKRIGRLCPKARSDTNCGPISTSGRRTKSSTNIAIAPSCRGRRISRPAASWGLDTVLITGTVTNVCCESSARDANMTNFRTIMVSDGNAALSQEEHDARR